MRRLRPSHVDADLQELATRVGVEGSSSYGAAVARHLVSEGVSTLEVPPHLSRDERKLTPELMEIACASYFVTDESHDDE